MKDLLQNIIIILIVIIACMLICGCEARTFTATRTDGTVIEYRRTSLFADSSSEGVSVSKDGDSLLVEVGATGSKTDLESLMKAIEIGAKLAAPVPLP